jgi:Skp family chaperone for outer membrane proteins
MSLFSTIRRTSQFAVQYVIRPAKGFRTGAVVFFGNIKNPVFLSHGTKRLLTNDPANGSSLMVVQPKSESSYWSKEVQSLAKFIGPNFASAVAIIGTFYNISAGVEGRVKEDVKEFKKEIKEEVNEIKTEVKEMIAETKNEVKEIKKEVKEMILETKKESKDIRKDMKEMNDETKKVMKEMNDETKVEIKEMKSEIKYGTYLIAGMIGLQLWLGQNTGKQ